MMNITSRLILGPLIFFIGICLGIYSLYSLGDAFWGENYSFGIGFAIRCASPFLAMGVLLLGIYITRKTFPVSIFVSEKNRRLSAENKKNGNEYYKNRNYVAALYEFRQASKLNPTDSDAWLGLGNAAKAVLEYDECLKAYKKVCDLQPTAENYLATARFEYEVGHLYRDRIRQSGGLYTVPGGAARWWSSAEQDTKQAVRLAKSLGRNAPPDYDLCEQVARKFIETAQYLTTRGVMRETDGRSAISQMYQTVIWLDAKLGERILVAEERATIKGIISLG